jgi:hypothetical protein
MKLGIHGGVAVIALAALIVGYGAVHVHQTQQALVVGSASRCGSSPSRGCTSRCR